MERSKIYNEHQVWRKYDFNFENQSEVQHSYNLSPAIKVNRDQSESCTQIWVALRGFDKLYQEFAGNSV
jgi:hypothetical protein